MVGRLGSAQLAAVGLSGITFAFSAVVFNFLLYITTPAIAAAIAQDDRDKVSAHSMKTEIEEKEGSSNLYT